jgi:hypothetical protein
VLVVVRGVLWLPRGRETVMVFYIIVIVLAVAFIAWFVRTPSFRHHMRGRGKDPGQAGGHAEGSMLNTNRDFRKN